MKPARILVLAISLVAGLAAALLASTSKPPEAVVQQPAPPPPPIPTDSVLVVKSASPGAIEELKGAKIRANLAASEPLRRRIAEYELDINAFQIDMVGLQKMLRTVMPGAAITARLAMVQSS
jgi:Flp pilus assembly protein CpaB